MTRRIYWGLAILIILLIGVSVFMLLRDTDTTPDVVYTDRDPVDTPRPPDEPGYKWVKREGQWEKVHMTPEEVRQQSETWENPSDSEGTTEYATEVDGYYKEGVKGMYVRGIPRDPDRFAHLPKPPLPPSAVPKDCPEHLKLPPEWIDGVYRDLEPDPPDDQFNPYSEEFRELMTDVVFEIVEEYNPKRPYTEIWDQFIEYEKMYRAYAEWELGYTPVASLAAGRLDWQYEQMWAFPEFAELQISENPPYGEESRFTSALNIAMGYTDQGWNKITLKDGRDFFIKGESRYEFVYSGVTEEGNKWQNISGFSRIPSTVDAPTVRIHVYDTSDEALEALMGWDYTINPITMRPLVYGSEHDYIYPRIMGVD